MSLVMIARVLAPDMKTLAGFRLLDTESKEIKDVPMTSLFAGMAKGVKIDNLGIVNGSIVGTNGAIERYGIINQKQGLVILKSLKQDGQTVGFIVSDEMGKVVTLKKEDVVTIAERIGIANGKVVDGTISSIRGNYEEVEIETVKKEREKQIKEAQERSCRTQTIVEKALQEDEENKANGKDSTAERIKKLRQSKTVVSKATGNSIEFDENGLYSHIVDIKLPNYDGNKMVDLRGWTVEEKMNRIYQMVMAIDKFAYCVLFELNATPVESFICPTMAVTDTGMLLYSCEFVRDTHVDALLFIVLHEIYHVVMRHATRGENKDPELFNDACDLYINKLLCEQFGLTPTGGKKLLTDDHKYNNSPLDRNYLRKDPYIEFGNYGYYSKDIDTNKDTPEVIYNRLLQEKIKQQEQQGQNGEQSKKGQNGNSNNNNQQSNENKDNEDKDKQQGNGSSSNENENEDQDGNNDGNGNKQKSNQKPQDGDEDCEDGAEGENGEGNQSKDKNQKGGSGKQEDGDDSEDGDGDSGQGQKSKSKNQGKGQGNGDSEDGDDGQDGDNSQGSQGKGKDNNGQDKNSDGQSGEASNSQGGLGNDVRKDRGNSARDGQRQNSDYGSLDSSNNKNNGNGNNSQGQGDNTGETSNSSEYTDGDNGDNPGGWQELSQQENILRKVLGNLEGIKRSDLLRDRKGLEQGKSANEAAIDAMMRRAEVHAKNIGAPAGSFIERLIQASMEKKVDFRALIKKQLLELSAFDRSFKQPDKRFVSRGLTLPGKTPLDPNKLKGVKICIDTSGSIGDKELAEDLGMVLQLMKQFKAEGEIIYWDTSVRAITEFKKVEDVLKSKPHGGGGTDVTCVFDYCNNRKLCKIPPTLIIVITDGYFSIADRAKLSAKYGKKTIWIINDDNYKNFQAPFGKKAPLKCKEN